MRAMGAGEFDRAISAATVNYNNIVRKIERTKATRDRRFFVFGNNDQGEARHVISIPIMKQYCWSPLGVARCGHLRNGSFASSFSDSSGPDHIYLMFDSLQIAPINLGDATRDREQVWNKAAGNKPINHFIDRQIARAAQRG